MSPTKCDRMMLLEAASSFERRQLDIPKTRAYRRRASLTRRVNVFEDYDQTESMNTTRKILARVNALEDSVRRQSPNDTNKMAVRAMKQHTNSLTSDRLARSRSTCNSTQLGDIGRESKLEMYDRIQKEVNHLKTPPMSPSRPHGEEHRTTKLSEISSKLGQYQLDQKIAPPFLQKMKRWL